MLVPDCSTVIRGAPRLVASTWGLVVSALRCSQVYPKSSQALRGVPKLDTITPMVLLYQSAEMSVTPNAGQNAHQWSDTLLWLTHQVYTPHPLGHFWRLPETIINLANVNVHKLSFCQPDVCTHILFFPALDHLDLMHLRRIASTILILIQIWRLMMEHQMVSTLSAVWSCS